MWKWLRRTPMILLLLPLVALIILSDRFAQPLLLPSSEVSLLDTTRFFRVVVADYPLEKPHTFRHEVQILPSRTRAYVYLWKDSTRMQPALGDTLLLHARFQCGDSIGSFDYGRYLRRKGIIGHAFVRSCDWKVLAPCSGASGIPLSLLPRHVQHLLQERYRQMGIKGSELATLSALTLGAREELDKDVRLAFQRAGAAHILAVSGLHTGILYGLLLWLLTGFGHWTPLYDQLHRQRWLYATLVALLVGYALLTGTSPSVCRSVVMIALLLLARLWHRQPYSVNTVAAAACIILLVRPYDLFSVSFQLSFAAVTSIIVLVPCFLSVFPPLHKTGFLFSLLRYLRDLILVSLAAQLGTLPLTLYYFSATSNWFLLTNLMVIPLTFLLFCGGLLTLLLGSVPLLGCAIIWITNGLCRCLNLAVGWVEHLPGATTSAHLSCWGVMICYMVLVLFVGLFRRYTTSHSSYSAAVEPLNS